MRANDKLHILLEYFHNRKNQLIDSYDTQLQELMQISQRQLSRELKSLSKNYSAIVEVKNGKKLAYKYVDKIDILNEMFKANHNNIDMLFQMAQEGMPELFEEMEKNTFKNDTPYLFNNQPLEDIQELQKNENFNLLKNSVIRRRYVDILMDTGEKFINAKPIKIIFSDGNWYIAFIYQNNLFVRRINFILKTKPSKKIDTFQPLSIQKYIYFLKTHFQNSMTLHDTKPKKAKLLAKPNIAKYFKANMKTFLKTQRFLKEHNDGSIEFEIKYTQELEILPLVQKWLPDITILEPQELKEAYIKKLKTALKFSI